MRLEMAMLALIQSPGYKTLPHSYFPLSLYQNTVQPYLSGHPSIGAHGKCDSPMTSLPRYLEREEFLPSFHARRLLKRARPNGRTQGHDGTITACLLACCNLHS